MLSLALLFLPAVASAADRVEPQLDAEQIRYFEQYVRPLLAEHCYACHSHDSGESSGELRVDTAQSLRTGGARGPAVVPGDAAGSLLVRAIRYDDPDLRMPPEGKLDDEEIAILEAWVHSGAPDPRQEQGDEVPQEGPRTDPGEHWSFQPVEHPEIPEGVIPDAADPVDALIADTASRAGVRPSPLAAREQVARRLYYDLVGVPPSAERLQRVVEDPRPDALRRLVDRLLADPRFGERFGRHWMDVTRYADTVGYTLAGQDKEIKGSHLYRDWIVRSLNADLPYDRFVSLQLAADKLSDDPADLDALGMLTIGRTFINNRQLIIDDQIDVTTRGLMGLTVACARCHDHKFDPIPAEDYYSLYGIFNNTKRVEGEEAEAHPLAVQDIPNPEDHPILVRGQIGNRGEIAPRRFVSVLRRDDDHFFRDGSGRAELAAAITDPSNPLTSRVWVNRVWGHLLGGYLVETPSDFGVQCPRPLQQAVLDDLAAGFIGAGFSTKRLIRRIVTTATYGRRSDGVADAVTRDPENRYWTRANLKRRDFESLRDSILSVTGGLGSSMYGEPFRVDQVPAPPRRTVYAYIDRQDLPGVFRVFDVASPDAHGERRYYTTVPQQALYLMNSEFLTRRATLAAQHIEQRMEARTPEQFVVAAFRSVLARAPSAAELDATVQFLAQPLYAADRPVLPSSTWDYGIASIDEAGVVQQFRPLPTFREGRWQGPEPLPDPEFGWTSLSADGGHPGQGLQSAAVRRWTAPVDGEVVIDGYVSHPSKEGNGVRLSIVAGGEVRRQMEPQGNRFPYKTVRFRVAAGDTVDFVADDKGDTNSDSFDWSIAIHLSGSDGYAQDFDAKGDFVGHRSEANAAPIDRRIQLVQALLMSNEFAFVE